MIWRAKALGFEQSGGPLSCGREVEVRGRDGGGPGRDPDAG